MISRRHFLTLASAFAVRPLWADDAPPQAGAPDAAAFFLIGDTHYLADKNNPSQLDPVSRAYTQRLVEWLKKLPGTEVPEAAGGGKVATPHGLIHAGDIIDSGDKNGGPYPAMQRTEHDAWLADYGLNGGDGALPWPVREVHGNHDGPHGEGLVLGRIRERNTRRAGLAKVSDNGLHYSWDWAGVHFVNLGIVVGGANGVERPRRFAPLDSLPFLIADLAEHVGDSRRPVVLTHHIDVARYCAPALPEKAASNEWDYADMLAYHDAIKRYRIAAILYGHTHARRIFEWDGQPPVKDGVPGGIPVFNTDNAAHFKMEEQAFLYFEITPKSVVVREFKSPDGWETAAWTPQAWRFPLALPA